MIELRGTARALLSEVAGLPTGLTRTRTPWYVRSALLALLMAVLGGGFALTWFATGALMPHELGAGSWRSMLAPLAALCALAWISALWWCVCRIARAPHLERRVDLAVQILSRVVPHAHPTQRAAVRIRRCPDALNHTLAIEAPLRDGKLLITVQERDGAWDLHTDAVGIALAAALGKPAITRMPGGVARQALLPLSDRRAVADTVGHWISPHDGTVRGHTPLEAPQPHVPNEHSSGWPRTARTMLREQRTLAVASPGSGGASSMRTLRLLGATLGVLFGAPVIAAFGPEAVADVDLGLLSAFAMLALGMPASLGWTLQPRRRVLPASTHVQELRAGARSLSLWSPHGRTRVDLARPHDVQWTRCADGRLGVRIAQGEASIAFCVLREVEADLPALENDWPEMDATFFTFEVAPLLRETAHGDRCPI